MRSHLRTVRLLLFVAAPILASLPAWAIPLRDVQAGLWPKATYSPTLMVAGAQGKALKAYGRASSGEVLDVGALREVAGQAEVLTPGGWVAYVPAQHAYIANVYRRVGPGWSWGNNSVHNSARGWWVAVYGREPTPMENIDIQYSGALFESLKAKATAGTTEPAPGPSPPAVIPPPPAPAPPPAPPPAPAPCSACPPCAAAEVTYLSARAPADGQAVEFWDRLSKMRHQGARFPGGVWVTHGGTFTDAQVYAWRLPPAAPEVR